MTAPAMLIANPDALAQLVAQVAAAPQVALDCEADSFHHYEEKLCLLQLTFGFQGGEVDWVVDPLARGMDLAPLLEVLSRKRLLLHAADNDLRLLGQRGGGLQAGEVFDTLIAAQYLGEPGLALAALLAKHFGVVLDKSLQKADWARRPLSAAMIAYAASDTHHLQALVAVLEQRLMEAGRLEWHRQACARVAAASAWPRRPKAEDPERWRVKGSSDLSAGERAVLQPLWRWREDLARSRDLAPFRVLGNDVLLRMARVARGTGRAQDAQALAPSRTTDAALRAALELGLSVPKEQWPGPRSQNPSGRPTAAQAALVAKLVAKRDRVAAALAIEPGVLASRSGLERLSDRDVPTVQELVETAGLLPWQAEALAQA